MTLAKLASALVLLAAAGYALALLGRVRHWRPRVLLGAVCVLALGYLVSALVSVSSWAFSWGMGTDDLVELGQAAILLLAVELMRHVWQRHQRVVQAFGLEQAYLTELFESSPEAIAATDASGTILRVNHAFAELFGFDASEAAGRNIDELLAQPERLTEAKGLQSRLAGGERIAVETVRRRKDGTAVDVAITGAPVMSEGRPVAVFCIYRDITRRRRVEEELRRLQKAVETTQLGVTVTDLRGRIIFTNPADAALHGYTVEELVGQDIRVFAPVGKRRPMAPSQLEAMSSWRRETANARKDGSVFPVHLMSDVVLDETGQVIAVVTTCEDITKRKEAEAALRESEERYALAARGANDGLWDWDVEKGVVYYSPRWQAILGFGPDEVEPTIEGWLRRVHPEDEERTRGELDRHLAGATAHYENEHRIRHRDGAYRWVLVRGVAVRGEDRKATRVAGSLTDVTPRKQVEEQLARDALYDPLTDLPNRAFFANLMERAARRARRKGYRFAVLFLDLDRFKLVNDSLGHDVGDQLLVNVSKRLEQCLRPGDVVARLAGDEFCILLDDIRGSADATRVAERIQEAFQTPFMLSGHRIFVSSSIGIATSDGSSGDPEHLLRDADTAMYRAKKRGKARFEIFDRAMHERAMEVLEMESDLRVGIEQSHFRLVYQPVVALGGEAIVGFEGLVRWEHPTKGTIQPAEFLPVAEETGLVVPLGFWAIREASHQVARWLREMPEPGDVFVSLNISRKQLQQADLVDRVAAYLKEAGAEPHHLKFEVGETVLMEDPDHNLDLIGRLSDLGVQVQIDKYGTGYSSLNYLSRCRVDTLKIDSSYTRNLGGDQDKSIMLRAMIALAHDLGIQVVAQGVETEEQEARLRDLDCEHAQGFLYSEPVEGTRVPDLLQRQRTE